MNLIIKKTGPSVLDGALGVYYVDLRGKCHWMYAADFMHYYTKTHT
jgi:hypothetical protein